MKKITGIAILIFVISIITFSKIAQTNNNDLYWMKIKAADKFERSTIANLGVSIEGYGDDYVIAYGNYEDKIRLEKSGKLLTSFALTEQMLDFPSEDSEFHNYEELTATLNEMVQQNPNIAQLKSIGKSNEGREIWAIRISENIGKNTSDKAGIIYMGGHHAREHLSVEMPLRFAQYLLNEYSKNNARIKNLIASRDIHIIPAVNPDGLEYDIASGSYKMWRKNRARNKDGTFGVDLNRNYGFQWGTGGSSRDTRSEVYMGPKPFSEPETQAIKNYVESNKNATILLSFHTFSELILYPWGHKYEGIEKAVDKAVHETMAQTMAQWNGYTPQQSSELYIASGDTTDWSYGALGMISFTFELDPKDMWSGGGFYPGAGVINEVIAKNIEPALFLMEYADNPYRVIKGNLSKGF